MAMSGWIASSLLLVILVTTCCCLFWVFSYYRVNILYLTSIGASSSYSCTGLIFEFEFGLLFLPTFQIAGEQF
jgi:hypothetical protein